jgi:hypothetical protein
MSRSRSPLRTSALLLAVTLATGGCGGDDEPAECGAGDAPAEALVLAGAGLEVRYGGFIAGPNNDCPDPTDPDAPTSLTIVGTQVGGEAPLTLCVRRPDRFTTAPADLATGAVIEDVAGSAGDCTLELDRSMAATGTLTATGLCLDGVEPSAFALEVSAEVSVIRTCGGVEDALRLTLAGRVAVEPLPPSTAR